MPLSLADGLSPAAASLDEAEARRGALRRLVRQSAEAGRLTPEAVIAHAQLNVVDDRGQPITPAPHHRLWLDFMCNTRIQKLLIIAPPESAKTTWLLLGYVGAAIGLFPERNVIIAGSSGDIARRRSEALRTMTESEAWRATYPGVLPARGMSWGQKEWSLAPSGQPAPGRLHPTVSAYGTGGPVIGSRADLAVADDILDFENTRTAHQRAVVWEWFHNTFLSRLKPDGRAIVIGTAWTHDDVYAKLRKQNGWVVCHLPLLSAGEEVYAYVTYPDGFEETTMLGEPLSGTIEDVLEATRRED